MTISPGGRPADSSPVGTPGGRQNWVDKVGGLPSYIRMVAHALIRKGQPKDRAIATAVNMMRKWAAGADNVRPQVQAAAAKALAEWEAKKGAAHSLATPVRVDAAELLDLAIPEPVLEWAVEAYDHDLPLDLARDYVRDQEGKFAPDVTDLARAWLKAQGVELTEDAADRFEGEVVSLAAEAGVALDLAPGDYQPPYDWKHGYIPITPAAALSKAGKGPHAGKGRTRTPKGVVKPPRVSNTGRKPKTQPAAQSPSVADRVKAADGVELARLAGNTDSRALARAAQREQQRRASSASRSRPDQARQVTSGGATPTAAERTRAQQAARRAGVLNPEVVDRMAQRLADRRAAGESSARVDVGGSTVILNTDVPRRGPSNDEKIANAAKMFGAGSPQHLEAIRRFGAQEQRRAAQRRAMTGRDDGAAGTGPRPGGAAKTTTGGDLPVQPTDEQIKAASTDDLNARLRTIEAVNPRAATADKIRTELGNRDAKAGDRRAQVRAIERKDYANADGPALADEAARRGLIGEQRARQKSDAELRKMLRDADERTAASFARGPSRGVSPGARTTPADPWGPKKSEGREEGGDVRGMSVTELVSLRNRMDNYIKGRAGGTASDEDVARWTRRRNDAIAALNRKTELEGGPSATPPSRSQRASRVTDAQREAMLDRAVKGGQNRADAARVLDKTLREAGDGTLEARLKYEGFITDAGIPKAPDPRARIGADKPGHQGRTGMSGKSRPKNQPTADEVERQRERNALADERLLRGLTDEVLDRNIARYEKTEVGRRSKTLADLKAEKARRADGPAQDDSSRGTLASDRPGTLEGSGGGRSTKADLTRASIGGEVSPEAYERLKADGFVGPSGIVTPEGKRAGIASKRVTKAGAERRAASQRALEAGPAPVKIDRKLTPDAARDLSDAELDRLAAKVGTSADDQAVIRGEKARRADKAKALNDNVRAQRERREAAEARGREANLKRQKDYEDRLARARGTSSPPSELQAEQASRTPGGITEGTARRMSDEQLDRAMRRLMADGTYTGPAFAVLEREMDRRDKARAEGNGRRR